MLRMTRVSENGITTLRLEGKLLAPWIEEVHAAIRSTSGDRIGRLVLTDLSFVDAAGARLLFELRRDGLLLVGLSPLVAGLIEAHSP